MKRTTPRLYDTRLPKRGSVHILRDGRCVVDADPDLAAYEQAIFKGRIPCPFSVVHKDRDGLVVTNQPIPMTATGQLKFDLFRGVEPTPAPLPRSQLAVAEPIEETGKAA